MGTGSGQDAGMETWETTQLLSDRYKVLQCLRRSGTCQLYRIEDVFRGRVHLALRPNPGTLAQLGGERWFKYYAQNALSLPPHPNVLTCIREDHDGLVPFLIMDDMDGRGWDVAIREGSLSGLPEMLGVAIQVGRGLAWLHAHDRLHFNVKPANVLLDKSCVAKVWKYGESGVKTRAYASPEQAGGDGPLTSASDVWSFAASVLHMFAGKAVWPTGDAAPLALQRYMESGPLNPQLPLMPGTLAELLEKCMKVDLQERIGGMAEVVSALEKIYEDAVNEPFIGPQPTAAPPTSAVIVPEGPLELEQVSEVIESSEAEALRLEAAEPQEPEGEAGRGGGRRFFRGPRQGKRPPRSR